MSSICACVHIAKTDIKILVAWLLLGTCTQETRDARSTALAD